MHVSRFFFKKSLMKLAASGRGLFCNETIFFSSIHTSSVSARFLEMKLRAPSSLKNSGPFFGYTGLIFVDSKKNKRYPSVFSSVWGMLLSTVNPFSSSWVLSVTVALLIWPHIVSGLFELKLNLTTNKLFQ